MVGHPLGRALLLRGGAAGRSPCRWYAHRCRPSGLWAAAPPPALPRQPARHFGAAAADVARSSDEGLLVGGDSALRRGSVVQHGGQAWACVFEAGNHWFAAPLGDVALAGRAGGAVPAGTIAGCLERPTPTQAERARLAKGVPTGIIAVDTLVPIGVGQSLIIGGPRGAGKSTLARGISGYAISTQQFDEAFWFCTEPPTECGGASHDPLDRLDEMPVRLARPDRQAGLLPALYAMVGAAEEARNAGKHALVVLDTISPLLHAWELAQQWAEDVRGEPLGSAVAGAQRRSCFAGLFERAGSLARSGGSLTLLALVDIDDEAGLKSMRRHSVSGKGSMFREMQSLSDGQAVLDGAAASAGRFPAVSFGATFSRFGLGSAEKQGKHESELRVSEVVRDVRHPALQAAAAHLRMQLALEADARFRPAPTAADALQSKRMRAVQAALLQPPAAPLRPEEMVMLLVAASSGAFDSLPDSEAARILRGGANAPVLRHVRAGSPHLLRRISEEGRISRSTAQELNVVLRLFVALQQAEVAPGGAAPADARA